MSISINIKSEKLSKSFLGLENLKVLCLQALGSVIQDSNILSQIGSNDITSTQKLSKSIKQLNNY
jgi:hypothetical protein